MYWTLHKSTLYNKFYNYFLHHIFCNLYVESTVKRTLNCIYLYRFLWLSEQKGTTKSTRRETSLNILHKKINIFSIFILNLLYLFMFRF